MKYKAIFFITNTYVDRLTYFDYYLGEFFVTRGNNKNNEVKKQRFFKITNKILSRKFQCFKILWRDQMLRLVQLQGLYIYIGRRRRERNIKIAKRKLVGFFDKRE